MPKGLIQLCYRKIITASSEKVWDKYVFEDTWMEFFMQAQNYTRDGSYHTFEEITENVPAADGLTYMVSTAAINYIRQLNDIIPDINNVSEKRCLPFKRFKFEIIHSDIRNKAVHQVAIYFYSEPLTWIDTVDGKLLIAYGDQRETLKSGQEVDTDLIPFQPYLTISSIVLATQEPDPEKKL